MHTRARAPTTPLLIPSPIRYEHARARTPETGSYYLYNASTGESEWCVGDDEAEGKPRHPKHPVQAEAGPGEEGREAEFVGDTHRAADDEGDWFGQ